MTELSISDALTFDSERKRAAIWEDVVELFRYRDLLWSLVRRDLTVRYKRSVLGFVWTMLNPLLMMLVMTVVFSLFLRFPIQHYPVYVLSGVLLWNLFSQSTIHAAGSLIWAGGLINKIYVPKPIFVASPVFVGLVNLLLALIPLALIMLVAGQPFSLALIVLPVPIFLTFVFSFGVALFISALAVFFVDIIDIYQVVLTAAMYLTPLFYPIDIVPPQYQLFLRLNPMYYFVQAFRQPIYQGTLPDPGILIPAALMAAASLGIGWWFFTRKSSEFAYRV